ncbi:hypothetical protein HAX54_004176 [Datura stramonium]|uniref:Uncharacterized protein n=1 Tax=Datura stramonium TaxID=4076 RepID=A0ABS8T7V0_DATST|nr:hypothetical protein [Datura stramonium]
MLKVKEQPVLESVIVRGWTMDISEKTIARILYGPHYQAPTSTIEFNHHIEALKRVKQLSVEESRYRLRVSEYDICMEGLTDEYMSMASSEQEARARGQAPWVSRRASQPDATSSALGREKGTFGFRSGAGGWRRSWQLIIQATAHRRGTISSTVTVTAVRFATDHHAWHHAQVLVLPSDRGLDGSLRE